jgi:hypothetical protein
VHSDNKAVAYHEGGVLYAKQPGTALLRIERNGLFAETRVEVAAHPRGTVTDWITGLPLVAGIVWTPAGLIISTRESKLCAPARTASSE